MASVRTAVALTAFVVAGHVAAGGGAVSPANHLAHEKSLYLQQHAHNPVDWYPWGEEAFAKARREDKPIFLSIGYSTCHWCHVMERESFTDATVAKALNDAFVAIKVDREERPDVDQIYMSAMQAQGEGGGWPLNVFLTPDLKPFHGGTYIPRDVFLRFLSVFRDAWKKDRKRIFAVADSVTRAVREISAANLAGKLDRSLFAALSDDRWQAFDPVYGGFGRAPKFPPAMTLRVLLREGSRRSIDMAERTLDAMWRGGMYDHVAGGFHRYSTDQQWLVPHFEKMLYDNALLATAYLEAYQATGRARFKQVGREILDYVLRDMRHPGGAFHAATDADSDGEEGLFFTWTPDELERVLGPDAAGFARVYGVTPAGNFERGRSILHLERPLEEWARELKLDPARLEEQLSAQRAKLHAAREKRPHPARDEKVVCSWAALMTSAFCAGAQVLDEPRYRDAAVAAGEFLFRELVQGDAVYRRWIDGHRAHPGTLEDVSYLSNMSIDLYETTGDPAWMERALRMADSLERFRDAKGGGYWLSEPRADLLVPVKDSYDGATPSGNGMAVLALARLAELTERKAVRGRAEAAAEAFAGAVKRAPAGFPNMLLGIELLVGDPHEIVVAGDPAAPATRALWRAVHARLLRARVLAHAGGPHAARAAALVPLLEGKAGGAPTAYVCRKRVCKKPVTDPAEVAAQLGQ